MTNLKYYFLTLLLVTSIAQSQNGPVLPNCPNCEMTNLISQPHAGLWWSPDLSGVGIGIEIQNNKLLGTYYGYDDAGQATWYTFVGDLVASNDPQVMWDVYATLNVFENGVCFNCEYQSPSITGFTAAIHIQFNQPNHASFNINDGEVQNIVPFSFGQNTHANFSELTNFEVPEITGSWVFAEAILPVHEFNPIRPVVLHLLPQIVRSNDNGTKELSVSGVVSDILFSVLNCKTYLNENNNISGPTCVLFGTVNDDGTSDNGYYVNLAGIGTNKIIGKKENGDTMEGFKMQFGEN
jgi:hypothetical protein